MPDDDAATPSEKALSEFRSRIAADISIPGPVKDAILADLASANPTALERLKAVLAAEGQDDEAEESKGT